MRAHEAEGRQVKLFRLRYDPALIARMAADLLRYDVAANESDAIRCLMNPERYASLDVALFAGEARRAALEQRPAIEKAA
jgi:hypothetical protein